jgi:hypothetical protein
VSQLPVPNTLVSDPTLDCLPLLHSRDGDLDRVESLVGVCQAIAIRISTFQSAVSSFKSNVWTLCRGTHGMLSMAMLLLCWIRKEEADI